HANVGEVEIRTILRSTGFHTMLEDALEKVVQGVTTLDEVTRVVPMDTNLELHLCQDCGARILPKFNFCPLCGLSVKDIGKETSIRMEGNQKKALLSHSIVINEKTDTRSGRETADCRLGFERKNSKPPRKNCPPAITLLP